MCWRQEKCTQRFSWTLEGEGLFVICRHKKRIILKWVLKNRTQMMWPRFICLRTDTMAAFWTQ